MAFRRPPTAQEAVLMELRRAIVARELAPGEQIVQDSVAERLGVSRVPVREALKILEGEGQVRYSPHHGYFVAKLELNELVEIYRIRQLIESEAIRTAAPLLTKEDLALMEKAVEEMAAANAEGDIATMTAANRRFHFTLFEAADLPRFVRIIRQLWDSSDPYRSLYYVSNEHRDDVDKEHRQILRAARRRDAERLVKLMDQHRDHAIAELKKMLSG